MGSGIEVGIWISTHLTKRKGAAQVTNMGSGAAARKGQPRPQGGPGAGGTPLPPCFLNEHLGPAEAPSTKSSESLPPGLRRPTGTCPRRPASKKRSRRPCAPSGRAHPLTRERGPAGSGSSEGEAAGRPGWTLRLEALLMATHLHVPFSSQNYFT